MLPQTYASSKTCEKASTCAVLLHVDSLVWHKNVSYMQGCP
jgi:hypothetical protein